jgi:hypothetical protein
MIDNFIPVWFLEGAILRGTGETSVPFEVKWDIEFEFTPLSPTAACLFIEQAREESRRMTLRS